MVQIKKINTVETVKLRKQGISYVNIAKILGISKGTVSRHLKKVEFQNGIRYTNNKQKIYARFSKIKKDYIEGKLSLEKISIKYDVERATLTLVFRKNGIKIKNCNEVRADLRELGLYKKSDTSGENNPNWRGGQSRIRYHGYTEESYFNWREQVFKRDNWTCQECGKRWNLNGHHIIPVRIDKKRILDTSNGVTLCEKCHEKTYMKELQYSTRYFSLVKNTAKAGV